MQPGLLSIDEQRGAADPKARIALMAALSAGVLLIPPAAHGELVGGQWDNAEGIEDSLRRGQSIGGGVQ